MAKTIWSDFLQNFPFWLVDIAPINGLALPILTPLFGFSRVTAPEIVIETETVVEGNYFFTRKIPKRASASNITLSRGTAFYDSDFWRWTKATLTGNTEGTLGVTLGGPTPRRVLLLVQFFARNPLYLESIGDANAALGIGAVAALAGVTGGVLSGVAGGVLAAGQVAAGAAIAATLDSFNLGPFEFAARLPAKAWILSNVVPARFKVSSDFDAKSTEVSIAELELAVELVEEIGLFG